MEILGIGPMELVLILIIAMMVFGPDKLPEIGAKLGQSMKAMRKATREFSREIEGARQAVQAPVQELTQPFKEITQPVKEIGQDLQSMAPLAQAVTNPQEALRQAVTGQLTTPEAQAAGANAAAATTGTGSETEVAPVDAAPDEAPAGPDPDEQAGDAAHGNVLETPADATLWQAAGVKPEKITRRKLDRTRRQRWEPGRSAEPPPVAESAESLPDRNAAGGFEEQSRAQAQPGAIEQSADAVSAQSDDGDLAALNGPAVAEE